MIAAAGATVRGDIDKLAQPDLPKPQADALRAEVKALDARTDALAQKYPQSDRVQTAAAKEALQSKDWTRGRTYGDRAVDLAQARRDPKALADALTARGTAAMMAGDFPQAASDAKRALEIAPGDKAAMALWQFSKGRLRADAPGLTPADPEMDRRAEAMLALISPLDDPGVKAAGRRATDHMEALKRLGEARRLYAVGDYPSALRETQAAMAADPDSPDVYMERALVFAALKQVVQALADVTKAISLWSRGGDPRSLAAGHSLRSTLRVRSGDAAGGLEDADKALSLDPRSAITYRYRAEAREALGQKKEQILADLKAAADLDPRLADDYADALARLSGRPAPPASAPRGARRLDALLLAAAGALAILTGVALKLSRRRGTRSAAAFKDGERRSLNAQYDIVEQIGEGGMGMVYKGWDKVLKRPVAVKRLRSELQGNARERERFIREAELVASLHHPHIVEIYTILREEDETFLVFEYIVGDTVHQMLNDSLGRHFAPDRALAVLKQIAEAVDHAHARRVIHRDLKPANVMVTDGGWVKVMDFGIARQVMDSLLTTTNTIVGTPTYMAPEQAMGAVVKESDVYALTCTLYEMLTGGLPYKGPDETRDKLDGRFVKPSALVPDLPPAIDDVIARGLDPKVETRYHSCLELYRAAASALRDGVTPLPS